MSAIVTANPGINSNMTEFLIQVYTTTIFFLMITPLPQQPFISLMLKMLFPNYQVNQNFRLSHPNEHFTQNTYFNNIQSTFFIFQKLNIQSKLFPKYFHRQRIKKDFNYTDMVTILP